MDVDPAVNGRYGRMTIGLYLGVNAFLLILISGGSWFFAARANNRGIAPNTSLGFRSQYTLSSLHGWYVAQRVGFHFAAVAATAITCAVFAIVAIAFFRRSNPMWMLFIPVIGDLAIAGCFIVAGQRADQAAISVEKSVAFAFSVVREPNSRCQDACSGRLRAGERGSIEALLIGLQPATVGKTSWALAGLCEVRG